MVPITNKCYQARSKDDYTRVMLDMPTITIPSQMPTSIKPLKNRVFRCQQAFEAYEIGCTIHQRRSNSVVDRSLPSPRSKRHFGYRLRAAGLGTTLQDEAIETRSNRIEGTVREPPLWPAFRTSLRNGVQIFSPTGSLFHTIDARISTNILTTNLYILERRHECDTDIHAAIPIYEAILPHD